MLLLDICSYLILALSVSFMWSFSEIFSPVRNFVAKIPYIRKPLICPECSSFWMGLLTSFFYNPLIEVVGIPSFAFCGLATHLFACFIYKLYFLMDGSINNNKYL
jgi:hypothetical protein